MMMKRAGFMVAKVERRGGVVGAVSESAEVKSYVSVLSLIGWLGDSDCVIGPAEREPRVATENSKPDVVGDEVRPADEDAALDK